MKYFELFLFFVITEASVPLSLPSYIKPCNRSDPDLNHCFERSANAAIPSMANGDPAYHVKTVKPLKWRRLLEVHIPPLTLSLIDIYAYGLDKFTVSNPNVNFDKKEIKMTLSTPLITWKAQYRIAVELGGFIPSEKVEGDIEISFPNGVYDITVEYEYFDLNNVQYANVTDAFALFKKLEVSFDFMGTKWNSVIEKAWAAAKSSFINKEVEEACGWAVAAYFNDIFNVVPFNQVFP